MPQNRNHQGTTHSSPICLIVFFFVIHNNANINKTSQLIISIKMLCERAQCHRRRRWLQPMNEMPNYISVVCRFDEQQEKIKKNKNQIMFVHVEFWTIFLFVWRTMNCIVHLDLDHIYWTIGWIHRVRLRWSLWVRNCNKEDILNYYIEHFVMCDGCDYLSLPPLLQARERSCKKNILNMWLSFAGHRAHAQYVQICCIHWCNVMATDRYTTRDWRYTAVDVAARQVATQFTSS